MTDCKICEIRFAQEAKIPKRPTKEVRTNPEYKAFWEKMAKIGWSANDLYVPFIRHTAFIPDGCPPCLICHGNVLIMGVGRYVIPSRKTMEAGMYIKGEEEVFLCGYCQDNLEKQGFRLDFN